MEPTGNPREWEIEGKRFGDPLVYSLDRQTTGTREIRLNIYREDGVTLLRAEIQRLTVLPPENRARGWLQYR